MKISKKTIAFLLLLCTLSLCLLSCNREKKKEQEIDLAKTYEEACALIEEKDYDAAYQKLKLLGDYKDAQKLLSYFHYAPVKIQVNSDGYQRETKISYNENGLPVQSISDENGQKTIWSLTYNEKSFLVKSAYTFADQSSETCEYFYDQNGSLTQSVSVSSQGETMTIDYAYDENGNLIHFTRTNSDGTKFYIEYVYDAKGNLIRTVHKSPDDYQEAYSYIYDKNGNLIQETCVDSYGDGYTGDFVYDSDGKDVKDTYMFSDGRTATTLYQHDANGNMTKLTYHEDDDTEVMEYEYQIFYIPYDLPESTEEMFEWSYWW